MLSPRPITHPASKRIAELNEAARQQAAVASEQACQAKMRKLGVVSTGPCIDVDAIVNDLAVGTYLFNKPKTVYVGEPFRLVLALKTMPGQDVAPFFAGLAGTVTEREGKFAQSLEATLRGDDLKIEPSGPQSRTATLANAIEWEWTLTPQSGGEKTLIIEVMANIQAGSDRHKVQIRTLREPIVIQATTLQRIGMYVAEAKGVILTVSATITALAGMASLVPRVRKYARVLWRRRRRPPDTDKPDKAPA